MSTAGSPSTSMRILCYRSRLPIIDQDPLSIYVQCRGGWMSVGRVSVDYYIPEDRAYMLYLYDSLIEPRPQQDYLV